MVGEECMLILCLQGYRCEQLSSRQKIQIMQNVLEFEEMCLSYFLQISRKAVRFLM